MNKTEKISIRLVAYCGVSQYTIRIAQPIRSRILHALAHFI